MKINKLLTVVLFVAALVASACSRATLPNNSVVIVSSAVEQDSEWMAVAEKLAEKHGADIISYTTTPRECDDALRELYPRYVAIVEKPENIGAYLPAASVGVGQNYDPILCDPTYQGLFFLVVEYREAARGYNRCVEKGREGTFVISALHDYGKRNFNFFHFLSPPRERRRPKEGNGHTRVLSRYIPLCRKILFCGKNRFLP